MRIGDFDPYSIVYVVAFAALGLAAVGVILTALHLLDHRRDRRRESRYRGSSEW